MLLKPGIRPHYSRAERISDGVIHIAGVTFALIAVPVLIALTTLSHEDKSIVLGTAIYGATLVAMLSFSALYNMIDSVRWTGLLQRLDHSGIYFKIAGTYTPLLLTTASPPMTLLAGLWGTAAFGSVMKFVAPHRFRWMAIVLYLSMGWTIVVVDRGMLSTMPVPVLWLMFCGGAAYTVGVVFYLFDRLPFHYTIWHVFVLTGSALFFAAISIKILTHIA